MDFNEKFIKKNIGPLCEEYDKIKGANTNLARIAPSLIDGLNPVQRRTLFIMFLKNSGETFRKVAAITGDVIARVHPHGQSSVYSALVGVSQDWRNSIPLIEGSGNFGTISGDEAGADRYIKARLSEYSRACFFESWKDSVVDTVLAFDEETQEPLYLPAKYPNVLLNGCIGIGYGMSSNIPPFNFKEVTDACIMLMTNPDANIVLIPDSPTGCDVIENDFAKVSNSGTGKYMMRSTYTIDPEKNIIVITSVPYMVTVNTIRERIADIKATGGLQELVDMEDKSGIDVDLRLKIRDDVNPYKFMRKLIKEVPVLEKSYPINITVTNEYESIDYSIKRLLLEWIKWDQEQTRIEVIHRKNSLLEEQRTNDVMIFVTREENLPDVIKIFKEGRNRKDIEPALIQKYRNSEIRMDSLQAKAVTDAGFLGLSIEAKEKYLKRRDELINELNEVNEILNTENGINKLIIAELRDGAKRFGYPRRSNVVPYKISVSSQVDGVCILQLSSDGTILRKLATNVYEEPIPTDNNGFAVRVDNDSSFILIDEHGYHSFIKVKNIPIDSEVPVNRYSKQVINGNIVAMLPVDIESDMCCTLISKKGVIKRIRISDMGPSKKPCIVIDSDDRIVKGIVTLIKSQKDLLIYTKNGMGQRLDPNSIRITSPNAKGGNGFKLDKDDEIVGCYAVNPEENQYLLYVTTKGKMRLNLIDYLPIRDSKHDAMVSLISLNDRDKLLSIVGCNKFDKLQVFFDDGSSEEIDISKLEETTMGSPAVKTVTKNMVSNSIVKVKLK